MSQITERSLANQIDDLREEIEQRRFRARDAVELLRETFTLRPDCNNIKDAAVDACNEMQAERIANAEQRCGNCGGTATSAVGTELKFEIERLRKELAAEVGRRADALAELNRFEQMYAGDQDRTTRRRKMILDALGEEDGPGFEAILTVLCVRHKALREGIAYCVGENCDEDPVFCTEHAGVAVTIANRKAEEFDEQGQ